LPFAPPALFGEPPLTWPPKPGTDIPLAPLDPGVAPFSAAGAHDAAPHTARSAHQRVLVFARQAFQRGTPIEVMDLCELPVWAFVAWRDRFI
jgi:hypothetical protein